jgi:hypothetical protein
MLLVKSDPGVPVSLKTATINPGITTDRELGAYGPTSQVFHTPVKSDPGVPVSLTTAIMNPGITTDSEPGAYGPMSSSKYTTHIPKVSADCSPVLQT